MRVFVNDNRLTKPMGVDKIFFKSTTQNNLKMYHSTNHFSEDVVINNPLGLHARAAAKIAALTKKVKSKVWIIKDGEKADASSVIEILTLACAQGSKITITIDDPADKHVLNDLVQLVESGFGEK